MAADSLVNSPGHGDGLPVLSTAGPHGFARCSRRPTSCASTAPGCCRPPPTASSRPAWPATSSSRRKRPPRQAKTAAAFAALLLPYSILGPFVGVFLDRWRRQRVLVVGNVGESRARARRRRARVGQLCRRRLLRDRRCARSASIGSSLPRCRPRCPASSTMTHLVTANALSTTSGSVATIVGVGIGGVIRVGAGSTPSADASIVALAALVYGLSATVAATMGRDLLGPDCPRPRARTPMGGRSRHCHGSRPGARPRPSSASWSRPPATSPAAAGRLARSVRSARTASCSASPR